MALTLNAADRVLIFAPHPDDETLAAGQLIQAALAVGATVRVVFATDGDNNPWPQRWLERRWSIGSVERERWGNRRRHEASASLATLGVADPQAVRFLGWPDQGLTEALMRDDDAVRLLAEEITKFAPTHAVMPALGDRHPDHSALRVMLELAILRSGSACVRLGYVVHGREATSYAHVVLDDAARSQRKQHAMLAHVSQIALSRKRLLDLAARRERFTIADATAPLDNRSPAVLRIPHGPDWTFARRHELLLVLATKNEVLRFRGDVPRLPRQHKIQLCDTQGLSLSLEWTPQTVAVTAPRLTSPLRAIYAKFDRVWPRLIIFDREPWHEATDLLRETTSMMKTGVADGLI